MTCTVPNLYPQLLFSHLAQKVIETNSKEAAHNGFLLIKNVVTLNDIKSLHFSSGDTSSYIQTQAALLQAHSIVMVDPWYVINIVYLKWLIQ
jgi:pyruvate/oxaloacetate carboxyltransferase